MAGEQPKKPVGGAYGIFLAEKRPEYTKACEGQKASAISSMAGGAWKKLSDEEKKPYQEKYEQAKAQFDKDMAAFLAAGGVKSKGVMALRAEKRKEKSGKASKDPNKPKKPAGGAYGIFLAENRAKIVSSLPKEHKVTDVSKAAGVQWKALSEEDKKPYEATYARKMEEYKKAMEEYRATHGDEADDDGEDQESEEKPDTLEKPKRVEKRAAGSGSEQPAKRGRGRGSGKASPAEPEIEAKLLKEAEALNLVSQIKKLAALPVVQSSGKSQKQMLEMLKANEGLVHKAKSALLGA